MWSRVWLSAGRGKEISYLEHLLWATKTTYGGDLQREEGRAAARQFSPLSVILQNIYLVLCKLTLLLPQNQPKNCLKTSPYCVRQTVQGQVSSLRQQPEGLSTRRKPCQRGAEEGQAHPQPALTSPCPSSGAGLCPSPALAGPPGGQTGGQRPLTPPLQLVWFLAVVFSGSSALAHAVHGPEQKGYNMWSLNYLTVPPFGIRERHGNGCSWHCGMAPWYNPVSQGCAGDAEGSHGCEPHGSQLFPGAHHPFSHFTWPPGSRGCHSSLHRLLFQAVQGERPSAFFMLFLKYLLPSAINTGHT